MGKNAPEPFFRGRDGPVSLSGPPAKGADRSSGLTYQGNRAAQLPFLPGNGVPLVPQVIGSAIWVAQPHGEAPLDVHNVKVASAANETSLAVCPDGHVRFAAHCASVAVTVTGTVAIARPFFCCTS